MTKILTIGAYERDNFGDLLFYLVLKMALRHRNDDCLLVPSSLIASDMRSTLGEFVFPYHFLLTRCQWDIIWIVGGEIGGVDIPMGMGMSLKRDCLDEYIKMSESEREAFRTYFIGHTGNHLAYLPNVSKYKNNTDAFVVVNSVGGLGQLEHAPPTIREDAFHTLRQAKQIAVRDFSSHEYLNSLGLRHNRLIPDSVHAIPFYYEGKRTAAEPPYALFQISEYLFQRCSVETLAAQLHEIIKKFGWKIYLFAAGVANYHDSIEQYEGLVALMRDLHAEDEVEVLRERNPLRLVDWIKNAAVWIGSSLHGRILSIAYSVPRVGLATEKLTNYCKLWDNQCPYDVKMDDLFTSCETALSIPTEDMRTPSALLSKMARENIENILREAYGT